MGSHSGPPSIFLIFFFVIFAIIVGRIVFAIVSKSGEWASNNAQPARADEAEIVAKRTEVSGGKNSTATTYYATFELPDSSRKELEVEGDDWKRPDRYRPGSRHNSASIFTAVT